MKVLADIINNFGVSEVAEIEAASPLWLRLRE